MPQKIVLDTDPGVDDVLAILLALASPEVDLALVSIVFGNTHAPVAHKNLIKIYHQLAKEIEVVPGADARYERLRGAEKTVLALGEDGPIGGEKAVAAYFHGPDGLSNISETHPHLTPPEIAHGEGHEHLEITSKPSYQAILDLLRKEPEDTVTIVALGPLTNLAHALRAEPETFQKVSRVVWMGGAFESPGNTSPVAEFNCFADPYAAAAILDATKAGKIELILAPLDITTPHAIPFYDLIHPSVVPIANETGKVPVKGEPTPLESFTSAMLVRVRGLQASFGLPDSMEMHDPVAVWFALAHASQKRGSAPAAGWRLKPREFLIERNGELTRGMCVVDRRGTGETGVDRSKDEKIKSQGLGKDELPEKDEGTGRMGETIDKTKNLPLVITHTPGTEVLREVLLSRVFGREF
ncbi:hydrolase [Cryptococcus wingfieldii CBS 7118]|uniref:Hydrolase n=1 Tax=Cryptococcus wingfieldii CBS 7118 TaxID=1295528 RepID=A0A1E3IW34_9TREE|nr:hydrolase [Cryptococcus wingfieldii CBS 7118]ODN92830.1 hydrolase [Cryptococcus wingfieldii CBS 7118]